MKTIKRNLYKNSFMHVNFVKNEQISEKAEFLVFGRVKTNFGAIIIPVTDDGRIVITKEYRIGADKRVIGVPKGAADYSDESLESIAQRELQQELGASFKELVITPIKIWPLPAFAEFYGQVVIAKGCKFDTEVELEDGEEISVHKLVSIDELKDMVGNGLIDDAESLSALQYYLLTK